MTACNQRQLKNVERNQVFDPDGVAFRQRILSIEYQALRLRYSVLAKQLSTDNFDRLALDYLKYKANNFSDIDQVGYDFAEFLELNSSLDKENIALAKLEWHWAMVGVI